MTMTNAREVTRYRLNRWLQRFEEMWDAVRKMSLIMSRKTNHLRSLPASFSETYSRALDRYWNRIPMFKQYDKIAPQIGFFGSRAIGCMEVSSEDILDLASNFPRNVGFSFANELIEYSVRAISQAKTVDEVLFAVERTHSLISIWSYNNSMDPILLGRIADVCGNKMVAEVLKPRCLNSCATRRILKIALDGDLGILKIGMRACEILGDISVCVGEFIEANNARFVDGDGYEGILRDGELDSYERLIDQCRGFLFFLESSNQLQESQKRTQDIVTWRERLKKNNLDKIHWDSHALHEIDRDDQKRLKPLLQQFLDRENMRNNNDAIVIVDSLRRGDELPSLKNIQFIWHNLKNHRQIEADIISWVFRLHEKDVAKFAKWAARKAVMEDYIRHMEPILGERIPFSRFKISDYGLFKRQRAGIRSTKVESDPVLDELTQIKYDSNT